MSDIFLQFVFCILIADFITGVFHWFEDCYGLPTWPIIGKLIIDPNIEHHRNPTFMITMGTIFGRNQQPLLAAGAALVVLWLVDLLYWQLVVVVVASSLGNEVHAWCHGGGRNRLVALLHDMALVQTPRHHAIHHKPPFADRFCTLTCWVNPIVDRIRFWRGVEWCIGLFGVKPKRMTAERSFL